MAVAGGSDALASANRVRLDTATIAELYTQHAQGLRFFLLGMLRDPELAGEALQATFVKALEFGHEADPGSLRAWLFRVAHNEAIQLRRRQSVDERAKARLFAGQTSAGQIAERLAEASDQGALRAESIEQVRAALASLPIEQREVVRLRIHDQKKFAEIAQELAVPLGTVLSRMHAALDKLRQRFRSDG